MGALPAVLIEAFSGGPFGGNGAAVVALEAPMPDDWMQAVAASLRQSETAFLLESKQGWMLRWFTPVCEVPLCGHATLAALLVGGSWPAAADASAGASAGASGSTAAKYAVNYIANSLHQRI
jgi:PhzF family phenazine biosynthesis protein